MEGLTKTVGVVWVGPLVDDRVSNHVDLLDRHHRPTAATASTAPPEIATGLA